MMEPAVIWNTGTLPLFGSNFYLVHTGENLEVYDHQHQPVSQLNAAFKALTVYDHYSVVQHEGGFKKISLPTGEIVEQLHLEHFQGITVNEQFQLITDLRNNVLSLYDLTNDGVLWTHHLDVPVRLVQFVTNGEYIVATTMKHDKKYCFDFKSGILLWELELEELNIRSESNKLGQNFISGNVVVGHTSERTWFGVDAGTKKLLWTSPQGSRAMGNKVEGNLLFSVQAAGEDIRLLVMDLISADVIHDYSILDGLQALFPEQDFNSLMQFGQVAKRNNELFFGHEKDLISLDLASGDVALRFQNDSKLMFSQVHAGRLFYTDNTFKLFAFDG